VGVRFASFDLGAECVREIAQSGLHPSNCRLLDAGEARLTSAGDGRHAVLVLGFESTDHPVEASLDRALELCAGHGGEVAPRGAQADAGADAVSSWREAFLGAPYLRDTLVAMGVLSETFETAITWDRFHSFHARVSAAAQEAVSRVCGERGHVFCRFTHIYPDGPAPYFTVLAPASRGEEVEQWAAIKRSVSDAIEAEGGTITHHHAVGRDHRPWYDAQRPEPFAAALRGAKRAVDPAGVMNPGVLLDPPA
jgi:alkyldihydroxyacetonephosphate synthase